MASWPATRETSFLDALHHDRWAVIYWKDIFDRTYAGIIDTWDYQLVYTCWKQNLVSIIPNVNLVNNIGMGEQATHTIVTAGFHDVPSRPIRFPLSHPETVARDIKADKYSADRIFRVKPSLLSRLLRVFRPKVKRWIGL
jgi:hypothetical protein